jgi:hypothetical protein
MPWIEMQCPGMKTKTRGGFLTEIGVPEQIANAFQPQEKGATIFTQSGLQAAFGGWSRDPKWFEDLAKDADNEKRASWDRLERELGRAMRGTWLMTAYPAILLAGVLLGVFMARRVRRLAMVAILSGAALTLVGAQVLQEFPLVQAYRDRALAWDRMQERPRTQKVIEDDIAHMFRFTRWFWLAQGFTVASLGLLAAEWRLCFGIAAAKAPHYLQ